MIRFCTLTLLLFFSSFLLAQKTDITLLKEADLNQDFYGKKDVQFPLIESKNPIIKYNPLSLSFGVLLFGYQNILSNQFSAQCIYEPSCSEFSHTMIKRFGIIKGVALSADRLMRCNKLGSLDIPEIRFNKSSGKVKESVEMFKTR